MNGSVDAGGPPTPNEGEIREGKGYVTERLGVWDILLVNEDYRLKLQRLYDDTTKSLPALYQMAHDIYSLSPTLFLLFCASQAWSSCKPALNLHFSSGLLQVMESVLSGRISDPAIVYRSVLTRLLSLAFTGYISWYNQRLLSQMQRRIKSHFEVKIMKAKLGHSLEESGSAAHRISIDSSQMWHAFEEIVQLFGWIIDALSQLTLILHLSRRGGSPLFVIFCIIKPLVTSFTRQSLWDKVCIVKQNNKSQVRMEALTSLTRSYYRQDVISGNLQEYIITEYEKACKEMGDISDDYPSTLYDQFRTPWSEMILNTLGDLPIFYCAMLAATNPTQVSFSSIAILQESASSMAWSVEVLAGGMERYRKSLKRIKELYEINKVSTKKPIVKSYKTDERQASKVDASARAGGMAFDLRDVSFSYPGSQTKSKALQNINLTIKPGNFVVIVGSNGSGKSTLVKLLARIYQHPDTDDSEDESTDSDSSLVTGEILIDSFPASAYTESSLRRSMAILSQENLLYPGFSLGENIGLGYTSLLSDQDATMDAAKKAGAAEVLERMKEGTNTVLDPMLTYYDYNVRSQDKGHPLKEVLKNLRRTVEVSGGERQRLVAARTFMRFKSGKIRLLVVDEPSSALDAEAEVTLLENLLKEREGKTVIFVTHRFGKLTRQADVIICMKEGNIAESGTHEELMKSDGEYKKLYDIQASAFQGEAKGKTNATE